MTITMQENHFNETERGENVHFSPLSDFDIDLFKAGKHFHLYNKLGAHVME
jgi:hypothetical protein